jgi:cytochrome P450
VLSGYDIPKNTFALASLHALHFDKELWKDPENFRPERYLDYKGRFQTKKDPSLPFGAGRRLCAGERSFVKFFFDNNLNS